MKHLVICILPDSSLNRVIANTLEETAEVYTATTMTDAETMMRNFGPKAAAVIIDSFEHRADMPLRARSLDFIRHARQLTKAKFFGHSMFTNIRESMHAPDLCHEVYDILELTTALEIHLASLRGGTP